MIDTIDRSSLAHLRCLLAGLAAVLCGTSCASSSTSMAIPARPAEKTTIQATRKGCRRLDDNAAESGIAAGLKRFEFRLPRTTSAVWVAIEGKGVFFKSYDELLPRCFALDLPSGETRVAVYAETRNVTRDEQVGLQVGLDVWEYAAPREHGPSRYHTFKYRCGLGASPCTRQELDEWLAHQRALDRGLLAPCGSVQIKQVISQGQRVEKGSQRFKDLAVSFIMKVYAFEPHRRPGDPRCIKRRK